MSITFLGSGIPINLYLPLASWVGGRSKELHFKITALPWMINNNVSTLHVYRVSHFGGVFPFSLKILPCRHPMLCTMELYGNITSNSKCTLKTLLNIICILYIYIYNIYSIFKGRQYYHYSKVSPAFLLTSVLNAEQSCWIDKRQAAKPLALTWRIKIAMIPIPKDPCIVIYVG